MQQNGEIGNKESKGDALLEPEFEQAKLDGGTTKLPELRFGGQCKSMEHKDCI